MSKIPPEKLVQIEANFLPPPFQVLNVPAATKTVARGINRGGIVVGTYWTDSDFKQRHGFRYNPASHIYDTFDVPVGFVAGERVQKADTGAAGINDQGYIVGDFATDKGEYGYRLRPWPLSLQYKVGGTQPSVQRFNIVDLRDADDDLIEKVGGLANADSVGTHATCINNDLYIGGRIFTSGQKKDEVHGFVLTGGDVRRAWTEYIRIDAYPGWLLTEVYGINSYRADPAGFRADVVGVASKELPTDAQAFIRYDATADVPPPHATTVFKPSPQETFARARGINSGRQVVGQYTTSADNIAVQSRPGSGFIRNFNEQNSSSIAIDVSIAADWHSFWFGPITRAKSTYAHGINDDGYIVGEFTEELGKAPRTQGFILHPGLWYLWLLARGKTRAEAENLRNLPEPGPIPVPQWFWDRTSAARTRRRKQ